MVLWIRVDRVEFDSSVAGPRFRPLTPAFVMSYNSCLDYSSIGGPTTLKFSPYGSGGNSAKGTGSGSKSDSGF